MPAGAPKKAQKRSTSKKLDAKRRARERAAAAREAKRRVERRRWLVTIAAIVAVSGVLIGLTVWAVWPREDPQVALPKPVSGRQEEPPPWPVPVDPVAGARRAGLDVQPMEGTAKHFHSHLDAIVDGEPVVVPANLGIDPSGNAMSELHTHDERGVLHVEAPTADKRYVSARW